MIVILYTISALVHGENTGAGAWKKLFIGSQARGQAEAGSDIVIFTFPFVNCPSMRLSDIFQVITFMRPTREAG